MASADPLSREWASSSIGNRARARSISEFEGLRVSAGDLEKQRTDSEFGPYTLWQLLAPIIGAHDHYHLGQIFKSYSALHGNEIGPWQHCLNLSKIPIYRGRTLADRYIDRERV